MNVTMREYVYKLYNSRIACKCIEKKNLKKKGRRKDVKKRKLKLIYDIKIEKLQRFFTIRKRKLQLHF